MNDQKPIRVRELGQEIEAARSARYRSQTLFANEVPGLSQTLVSFLENSKFDQIRNPATLRAAVEHLRLEQPERFLEARDYLIQRAQVVARGEYVACLNPSCARVVVMRDKDGWRHFPMILRASAVESDHCEVCGEVFDRVCRDSGCAALIRPGAHCASCHKAYIEPAGLDAYRGETAESLNRLRQQVLMNLGLLGEVPQRPSRVSG